MTSAPLRALRRAPRRFGVRLVAAMVAVSLPLLVLMAVLLTSHASASLTEAGQRRGESVARAVTLRLEDWLVERRAGLRLLAAQLPATLSGPAVDATLRRADAGYDDYDAVQVLDTSGRVLASSRADLTLQTAGQAWLAAAAGGAVTVSSPVRVGDRLQWVIAAPVRTGRGPVRGVLVADLAVPVLSRLLDPELDAASEVIAVDADHRLVFDTTTMRGAHTDAALLTDGALGTTVTDAATAAAARTGDAGSARFTDPSGHDVIGGYDVVDDLHWTVLTGERAATVLAPVTSQRHRAEWIVALGALLALAASSLLSWRTTRPVRRLTEVARRAARGDLSARVVPQGPIELVMLGDSVNHMIEGCGQLISSASSAGVEMNSAAAELSASSDELAATTTQQSAAVIQATATTEELARASAAIAETVDEVARQAAETRDNLERAEADITDSGERTLALADRVADIDALRVLINDIADQTNLLALNAAIEAARAGDHGIGFAVVADEVRRLAERSKSSAGDIATIIAAVKDETHATVMAMDKGAKQMQHGLALLSAVTDAAGQVRLTTQQQRSANAQVVETMEQLTDASRQVSATAQQIAAAAGSLSDLAGDLESSATSLTGLRA